MTTQSSDSSDMLARELANITIQEKRWSKGKHVVTILVMLLVVFFQVTFLAPIFKNTFVPKASNSLGVVRVTGEMSSGALGGADRVIPALKAAFEDDGVKRVALYIDSPGGSPVEAERIKTYMQQKRKETGKPTVAIFGNMGASAAYLTALGADELVSGRFSLVGSIGAIIHGWDVSKVLETVRVAHHVYASGPLKAMLNPFIPPTPEGELKANALVSRAGGLFAREVAASRGKKLKTTDFASGEVWDGEAALDLGLVDSLNTLDGYALSKKLDITEFGPSEKKGLGMLSAMAEGEHGLAMAQTLLEVKNLLSQVNTPGFR